VLCDSGNGSALNISVTGGTMTIPVPTAPKFYLLDGPRAAKITSVKRVNSNTQLEIKYNYQ